MIETKERKKAKQRGNIQIAEEKGNAIL